MSQKATQNKTQDKTLSLFKKTVSRGLAVLVSLSSLQALSAIPYRNAFEQADLINNETKELNLSLLAKIQAIVDQNQFDMTKYIPYSSLNEYSSGEAVGNRIFRQTLKTLLDTESIARAPVVRGATTLQNALGANVGTTQHQFGFRINAIETQAEMTYNGVVAAKLSYDLTAGNTKFELSKKLGTQTYAYTHNKTSEGFADNFGVRWSF